MIRLFYLIGEPSEGYRTGHRKAIYNLINEGEISEVTFFSFKALEKSLGSWKRVMEKFIRDVNYFNPNIILVHHIHKEIPKWVFDHINRTLRNKPFWIYDETDAYGIGIVSKRLPIAVLRTAIRCDLVTLTSYGRMMKIFKMFGAKNVEYLPIAYDANFGTEWTPSLNRPYDVIMIANIYKSKIPFLSMPGKKQRIEIVMKFSRAFGDKFAVFGNGWQGFPCAKGPISFFDQEKVNRQSWLTIGMDHFFDYDGYYSDRLPIALVSGVVHLSHRTPGLENSFEDKKDIFFYKTPAEALSIAQDLLKLPKEELIAMGASTRKKFLHKLSEETRFKKMLRLALRDNENCQA